MNSIVDALDRYIAVVLETVSWRVLLWLARGWLVFMVAYMIFEAAR